MCVHFFKRFKNDERGTATIESLLWFPLFFFLFILIIDASFLFYGKAQVLRFVQDENRALAVWVGKEADWTAKELAAEARLKSRIEDLMLNPNASELAAITVSIEKVPNVDESGQIDGEIIQTKVSLPGQPLMAVGSLPEFSSTRISVRAQHYREK